MRELLNLAGQVISRFDYDPWGQRSWISGTVDSSFGYAGYFRHAASGLDLTLFRAYDPELGRWLSRDPILESGGLNVYGYVGNSGVNGVDVWGLDWIYEQSTGDLYYQPTEEAGGGPPQLIYSEGYAGHGEGINNSSMQNVPFVGPIPQGTYDIGQAYDNPNLGPVTMNLTPSATNNMYGRDLFRIHGDNGRSDQSASEGCIVLSRPARVNISNSTDRTLQVVP